VRPLLPAARRRAVLRLLALRRLRGIRRRGGRDRVLELLREVVGTELLQVRELLLSARAVAALEQRLAVVLARRRVVGLDLEAGGVGLERLLVVPELAPREALQVQRLVVFLVELQRLVRTVDRAL
jgi:hypothetical protein